MGVSTALRRARTELHDAGLDGSILVRDLDTGDELGLDAELELPIASLVKVPLVLATMERVMRGEIDPAAPIRVLPGRSTVAGPTGLSRFRHPATVAVEDLMYLSIAISDGGATDALFELTPPAAVTAELRRLGHEGIAVRHLADDLVRTPAEQFAPADGHLAHALAIEAATAGRGHPVTQLDISHANTGTARAFVDLLAEMWRPVRAHRDAAARVREFLSGNLLRQRLAPDFSSDATRWSSKTGTLLNLRHEAGVAEHADGQTLAVAVLTRSRVPAVVQPGAEAAMATAARILHDELRMRPS
ncbi:MULTISPECIES: serine hydrolase [Nocardia]|uniref:Serine hydrolase n=2 Tax=Nocardia TaxID=1817 RepID=A0A2T2ZDS7_9NOCA|nr:MULTISPECIES: serine hydrolase [Nocardia]MBF6242879.1 serine hydrolase [Nocardia elegans]PSR65925.1 serine hydrolase [Nocardia nova]